MFSDKLDSAIYEFNVLYRVLKFLEKVITTVLLCVELSAVLLPHFGIPLLTSEIHESPNYLAEYDLTHPPYFILGISFLQVFIYVAYCICFKTGFHPHESGQTKLYLHFDHRHPLFLWSYFTSVLVHAGYVHLAKNVVMQLIVGIPLELVHQSYRIAPIYLLSSFTGLLVNRIIEPQMDFFGCSNAVYGLYGAQVANICFNWAEMPLRLPRIFAAASLGLLILLVLIARGMIPSENMESINDSFYGHFVSYLSGIALGTIFLRYLQVTPHKLLAWVGAVLLFTLIIFCLIIFGVYEIPKCDCMICKRDEYFKELRASLNLFLDAYEKNPDPTVETMVEEIKISLTIIGYIRDNEKMAHEKYVQRLRESGNNLGTVFDILAGVPISSLVHSPYQLPSNVDLMIKHMDMCKMLIHAADSATYSNSF